MAGDHRPPFGSLLQRYRRAARLTQEELAERAGYNPNYISMLERGVRAASAPTIELLAEALELSSGDRVVFRVAAQQQSLLEPEEAEGGASSAGAPGVRTFLLADVRGYTRFTLEHGDEEAARLTERFAATAHEVAAAHEGAVIELRGDEALAVFSSARQALRAAVALQERFAKQSSEDPALPLKVGIGLDAGEAIPVDGGYRGAALNLAARLCSLAGAGEVLASEGVMHLARKLDGLTYAERGAVQLKGFSDAVRVVQVVAEEAAEQPGGASKMETAWERPLPIGGFLGALPSGPLVAREAELGKVLAVADAVAGGSGRLVFLVGEPGIGKTRLAQEVTLALRNRGFVVASGRCYEPQEAVPYYPFLEALGTLYGAAPAAIRAEVGRRWPSLLRLLPNLEAPPPGSSAEGKEEQERLFWAVTGFVQAHAAEVPVALLLDDLHWADSTSVALLQHLARHTRAYRVLLLGTYRDVEVGRQHLLERALRDLGREQLAERILIRRLEEEGTAALIATSFGEEEVSAEFAELIYRQTEGNPFFTQEVLHALVERGDISREDGRWKRREIEQIEVPESIRSAIGERLARLGDTVQELLHEASVLGPVFRFEELQAMTNRLEAEVEAGPEEATSAGLIRETVADQYGFNHALTQQALYAELSGRRKRRLQLAAGEAIEQIGAGRAGAGTTRSAELAWHFLEGDATERALRYALQAGDEAEEVFAHEEARRHYRTAGELARDIGDAPQEAEALEKLGVLLQVTTEFAEAARLLERARELYECLGSRLMETRVAVEVVPTYGFRGLIEERDRALQRAERLVSSLEGLEPTRDLALVYQGLADLLVRRGRYGEAVALNEREAEVARALGDDRLLNRAEVDRASALGMLGRIRDAVHVAESIILRAEVAGDLRTALEALSTVAWYSMWMGDFGKSRACRERELAVAERVGDRLRTGYALSNLSVLSRYQGDWDAAIGYAERAFAVFSASGDIEQHAHLVARANRGPIFLLRGDSEQGIQDLESAARLSTVWRQRYVHRELAQHDLLIGRPEEALRRLEPLVQGADRQYTDVIQLLPILAWAHLEMGEIANAAQLAGEARELATSGQNALALVDALRVHGMVLAQQQRWRDAEQAFAEAVSLARSMPYPYAEACALYEWGRMSATKGEPVRAQQRLEEARQIFRRLGARPYMERAQQALEKLGEG